MESKNGIPNAPLGNESAAYDWLIGQTISANYRLVKRLGSGAMATVFQAEQLSLRKMVAIKVMRSELMAEPKLIERFEFEARAASALNHPNLIQIIDCGRDRGFLYIAMELLPGIDLGQLLRQEPRLPLARSVHIIDQVLSAADEAHTHGIVHRDLKPDNIMLVPRRGDPDVVKVCDFGVAKASTREFPNLTVTGLLFGTPEYMSPEQARGIQVDGRSDLYSIATIFYELIVGRIPFVSSTPADVLARQLLETPAPPSSHPDVSIPPVLERLIMRGLAKHPSERPQTAAEFQEELHHALASVERRSSKGARAEWATRPPLSLGVPRVSTTLQGSQPPELPGPATPSSRIAGTRLSFLSARDSMTRKRIALLASVFLVAAIGSAGAFVVTRKDENRARINRAASSGATARLPVIIPIAHPKRTLARPAMEDEAIAEDEHEVAAEDLNPPATASGRALLTARSRRLR